MNDGKITDDLILLHGDVLNEHITSLRSILLSDNVYCVTGPKEYVIPGTVQVILRISEVIDFHRDISLYNLFKVHCEVFNTIKDYFINLDREVDYSGFDILFDYLMIQFTILFMAPVDNIKPGLEKLQQDIPDLISQPNSGCIKYLLTADGKKNIIDCKDFKDLYKIGA